MSTVLLFGAAGFLGRHVRTALRPDADLVCPTRTDCDLLDVDVADLTDFVGTIRPDAVINCTGRLDGGGYAMVRAHTLVTAKLIEAVAAAAPRARLVRLGSAGEYGRVPFGDAVSEDAPAEPVSGYGVSHAAGTRLVELAIAAGQVDAMVLRVFNPVGAGLPADTVLGRAAALLRQAMTDGAPPTDRPLVMGPLDAHRDFVDVRDVAGAVRAAVHVRDPRRRVLNVGSGQAVETRHAVRLLARAAGFRGDIQERAATGPANRTADIPWMRADISAAGHVLGWKPTYELADSVTSLWTDRP